jgi:hypothetical protein
MRSMTVEAPGEADALSADRAVARALGGEDAAAEAAEMPESALSAAPECHR